MMRKQMFSWYLVTMEGGGGRAIYNDGRFLAVSIHAPLKLYDVSLPSLITYSYCEVCT